MIKLTPTQSSWELELNTSKFYDFLSHDTVASLDHVVDSAMMTELGIKPPSIHPVLSNVTVLNLTLQVVKRMYEEDSDQTIVQGNDKFVLLFPTYLFLGNISKKMNQLQSTHIMEN